MPLNPYQTDQYQDFSEQPQKKSKMPIIAIAVVVIIAILAFLYIIGSGEKDSAERADTLSEQEKLEILNSLTNENIIRPSVEERQAIIESLSASNRPAGGNGNGNGGGASAGEIQGLTEEEKLQVIQSLRFQ
jgi:flagellar biosynthesis/type III secretory pathway M-ring protein FliF/YscJ